MVVVVPGCDHLSYHFSLVVLLLLVHHHGRIVLVRSTHPVVAAAAAAAADADADSDAHSCETAHHEDLPPHLCLLARRKLLVVRRMILFLGLKRQVLYREVLL